MANQIPKRATPRHPFGELLQRYRLRKPSLSQRNLAELAGYDQAILVRMAQGKKDLTGPSGRERIVRLIEILSEQGAISTLDEANALLLSASLPPLFELQPTEARLIERLANGDRTRHYVRRTNLPSQINSFIGRTYEISEIRAWLAKTRLLTLIGAGGCGKTRLAQQVAADVLIRYPNGVWYVELATLTQPHQVVENLAAIFGLAVTEQDAYEEVSGFLRDRQMLIVLDNCEHLIEPVALFALAILKACPGLTLLATSREALDIEAEVIWRVPPMQMSESAQLFIQRGSAVRPDLQISQQDTRVSDICAKLDGMPLAIEIAASRLLNMSLDDLALQLKNHLSLLSIGRRNINTRHQTLQALIQWSYDLLNEQERVVLRRLSVLIGKWTLDIAEQVVSDNLSTSAIAIEPQNVATLILRLASKSLVSVDNNDGQTRYSCLELIRQFGHTKLIEHQELEVVLRRHAKALEQLAWQSEQGLRGEQQSQWLQMLNDYFPNFQAAIAWSFGQAREDELGCSIVAGLYSFLIIAMTRLSDAQRWSRLALERMTPSMPPKLRGYLHLLPAWVDTLSLRRVIEVSRAAYTCFIQTDTIDDIAFAQGTLGRFLLKLDPSSIEGKQHLKSALELINQTSSEWVKAAVEVGAAANSAYEQKDFAEAEKWYRASVVASKKRNDFDGVTVVAQMLATVLMQRLNFEEALIYLEESYQAAIKISDPLYLMWTQSHQALANFRLGNVDTAKVYAHKALTVAREQLPERHRKLVLHTLARIACDSDDLSTAKSLMSEVYQITRRQVGDKPGWYGVLLDVIACIAVKDGSALMGVQLFGAAEKDYESVHLAAVMLEATQLDAFNGHRAIYNEHGNAPYIDSAKTTLGDGGFEAAFIEGKALPFQMLHTLAQRILM